VCPQYVLTIIDLFRGAGFILIGSSSRRRLFIHVAYKEQYRERLYQFRPNIYIGGDKVGRDDHRLAPGINVLDMTYELAHNPKWKGKKHVSQVGDWDVDKEMYTWATGTGKAKGLEAVEAFKLMVLVEEKPES
jgi:hypothetical protein